MFSSPSAHHAPYPSLSSSVPPSSALNGDGAHDDGDGDDARMRGTDEAEDADERRPPGRRRRIKVGRDQENVARVRDETGERVREKFEEFLANFVDENSEPPLSSAASASSMDGGVGRTFYIDQIKALKDFELTTLYVDFGHMLDKETVLAKAISDQYFRFLPYLRKALQSLVKQHAPEYLYTNTHTSATPSSGLSLRPFSIAFYNLPLVSAIRDLRTEKIGKLVSVGGTVTRTSEVRPELIAGTFMCENCQAQVREVEQQFKYTEPSICPNLQCSNRFAWKLSIEQSTFSDWQKVRIQENPNEIPTGSMPRSLDVILRAEVVEKAKAGDKCIFTGTFIVVPDVAQMGLPGVNAEMMREAQGGGKNASGGFGANAMGVTGLQSLGVRDLTYKTAFLACMVQNADARASAANVRSDPDEDHAEEENRKEFLESLTPQEVDELKEMVHSDRIYSRLVESIAPTVYGHEIVKKGILLQLMGGVHKQTHEGIHLRGDINVCIVGDPSTSKSQFLKYVCGFLPRSVYTSGKASSAAGLTAAVVKDEETGEFTIEAGALMLADNGICAIDEFDKMDISDQVAIHEAMEQQTISIAKAGIQATLNARTSILAAANPIWGRYNKKISLRANVAMSAPIMSRFDLFFVVLDECNESTDFALATHIVNVHRYRDVAINPEFSTDTLQRYIRYARTFNPKLTPEASNVLVEKYRDLRQDDSQGWGRNSYRITVRQLESMIRLSEAIARVHCVDVITPAFVKEAYNLLRQSIIHVEKDDIGLDEEDEGEEVAETGNGVNDDGMDVEEEENVPALPSDTPNETNDDTLPAPSLVLLRSKSKKPKVTISYEKYVNVTSLVVAKLSQVERDTSSGMIRGEVIQWYLEEMEEQIGSVEELEQEGILIDKVLTKLIKQKVLMDLKGSGEGLQSSEVESSNHEESMLLIHPECSLAETS